MGTYDLWVRTCFWGCIRSVRSGDSRLCDIQLRTRNEIGVLCGESALLESLHSGTEIRSNSYLVSPLDLNTIPSIEQDKMAVILVQFRPYLPVNRGFVLVITRYPEILRGNRSFSDVGHDDLEIVLDRSDGQEDRICNGAHDESVQQF